MKCRRKIIILIVATILVGALATGPIMSNVETPSYKVIQSKGKIEIREFDPMVIAEVQVVGRRKDAISSGFKLLADYIFGNNISQENIDTTATIQRPASEKIAMTAPVQQQLANNSWLVSFVMPSEYNLEDLPKPKNIEVKLKNVPVKRFVTIQFSGTSSDENLAKHKKLLVEFIKTNSISVTGTSKYAFYNPPWTLPLMRRNEVMFEVQ
ncbi:MAG: heme-binding protein [Thiotrichales bacterium]|nr:heme-binding protein [Thiotrichales bacterium]